MKKLRRLNLKLEKARGNYLSAIDDIQANVIDLTGYEDIVSNDFAGDGFAIGIGTNGDILAPINKLIEILEKTGKLTKDDIIDNSFL